MFSQLYTIHARIDGEVLPCVFSLLPNKLLVVLLNKSPDLNPSSIMVDFEQGAINAFKARFPDADMTGCFFHLCQNVYKHVQSNGLQQRYGQDADFALAVRMIPALVLFQSVTYQIVMKHWRTACRKTLIPSWVTLRSITSRIMYELEVCSDGTTEAQPRSFRQNRPTASTLSDIMQVQHMSRKIRENAETFPYLAKL